MAGTTIATDVDTGAPAAAAFARSWQLRETETRRSALILAGIAAVGTPFGWASPWPAAPSG